MAQAVYKFRGTMKWAQVYEPSKLYKVNEIDLYLDKASEILFKKSGLQLKIRYNEDGTFVKFRRNPFKAHSKTGELSGPPEVLFDGGEPFGTKIGNGSEGEILVAVYDTPKGKGHELLEVRVTKLIPYTGGGEVIEPDDNGDTSEEIVRVSPRVKVDEIPF